MFFGSFNSNLAGEGNVYSVYNVYWWRQCLGLSEIYKEYVHLKHMITMFCVMTSFYYTVVWL